MFEDVPKTRNEAVMKGLPRYFTGVPCIRGHVSVRTVADRQCLECRRKLNGRNRPSRSKVHLGKLSQKQIEVLQVFADGAIASGDLGHEIRLIMGELGARTIANAVAMGVRRGLID